MVKHHVATQEIARRNAPVHTNQPTRRNRRGGDFLIAVILLPVLFALSVISCSSASAQIATATADCWINAATGASVPNSALVPPGARQDPLDPNHATAPAVKAGHPDIIPDFAGADYVRVPCPPPATQGASNWSGGQLGVFVAGSFSNVRTTERLDATGIVTNKFSDCCTGVGGGVDVGWQWQLPHGALLGLMLDAWFPNDQVSHSFAGGTYLRSTVDFTVTFQLRAGYAATPRLLLYGQTGLAVGGQTLKVNFGGPISSHDDTTIGPTLGIGVEWRPFDGPTGWFGRSPALFVEYDHIWWDDAHFNTPAASPAFNYSWSRESNVIKCGLRVRF